MKQTYIFGDILRQNFKVYGWEHKKASAYYLLVLLMSDVSRHLQKTYLVDTFFCCLHIEMRIFVAYTAFTALLKPNVQQLTTIKISFSRSSRIRFLRFSKIQKRDFTFYVVFHTFSRTYGFSRCILPIFSPIINIVVPVNSDILRSYVWYDKQINFQTLNLLGFWGFPLRLEPPKVVSLSKTAVLVA